MSSARRQRQYAFGISVLGHALIVAALTFSITLPPSQPAGGPVVVPIETVMVDEGELNAAIARVEEERQAEIRRQREAEQRERDRLAREQRQREEAIRIAEERRIRAEAEAREAQERLEQMERERAEQERLAAEERQRQEAERQRQEAERLAQERAAAELRRRQEAVAAEIAAAAAAEQASRDAANAGLRDQWAAQIGQQVEQSWQRPPTATSDLVCVLVVTQLPTGQVIDVSVDDCTTSDPTIIRSLENAVMDASPLPQRPPGVAFERIVRIRFKPAE